MKKSIEEIYQKQLDTFSEIIKNSNDPDLRDIALTASEEGLYFTSRTISKYGACVAYYVPGPIWTVHQKAIAIRNGPMTKRVFDQAEKTARLAEKQTVKTNVGNCAKLTVESVTAYVRSSLLRAFPSDSMLYVTSWHDPIVVMVERDRQFYLLGLVMPTRPSDIKERA